MGIRTENVTIPVIVSRYFSRRMAPSASKKPVLRSASFSETGVPTSEGMAETRTEAVMAAADSPSTVACFSSRVAMVLRWNSADEAGPETTNMEISAMSSRMMMGKTFFRAVTLIIFSLFLYIL